MNYKTPPHPKFPSKTHPSESVFSEAVEEIASGKPIDRNRAKVVIIVDDCRHAIRALREPLGGHFTSIITSPPYFGLRNNGCGTRQIGLGSFAEYQAAILEICSGLRTLAKKEALFWLQIGDKWAGGGNGRPGKNAQVAKATTSRDVAGQFEVLPRGYKRRELMDLPGLCKESARTAGWMLINKIIWYKGKALPCAKDRLGDAYEHLLLFSKRPSWNMNKDALPDDLSGCRENVWCIPSNANDTAARYGVDHSSTFPPQLSGACAVLSSRPGEWILDPFGGLGNTAIGALRFGINTVLIEQNPDYAEATAKRLTDLPEEFRPDVKVFRFNNSTSLHLS
jgi:site-specific DNA-methyltransferase (adenine-specific)